MPTPGPNSPTKALDSGPDSIPSVITREDHVSMVHLSAEEIRQQLLARERDIKFRLDALKHEALSVLDDVNVEGRPLGDRIRERPLAFVGGAAGVGATVGILLGLRARAKRRPDPDDQIDFIRARLALALDDAARRVAGGAGVDEALRDSMDTMPVAYSAAPEPSTSGPHRRQALDLLVKSAAGFAIKAVVDVLVSRFSPHEEVLAALADEAT